MRKCFGVTLIEFVMVTLLLSIVAITISRVYIQGLTTQRTVARSNDAVWQGQVAFQRMVRDIRQVRAAVNVTTMTSARLTFIDMSGATIDYQLSGSTLTRNSVALADGVSSLTFTYKDKSNSVVATNTNLSYINIALSINQNNSNYSLTTGVYLRDLSS